MNPFDLTGRIALVTGAARGLGHAMATALAQAGATVVFNGRDLAALEAARSTLARDGRATDTSVFDVTDVAAVSAGIDAIEAKHGALDIVINNAGIQRRNAVQHSRRRTGTPSSPPISPRRSWSRRPRCPGCAHASGVPSSTSRR